MPIPPSPGGVEIAAIVSSSQGCTCKARKDGVKIHSVFGRFLRLAFTPAAIGVFARGNRNTSHKSAAFAKCFNRRVILKR